MRRSLPPESRDLPPDADAFAAPPTPPQATEEWLPCPVDRLPRRRRNQICIVIIALGLANYLAYTLTYAALGGDAQNGRRERVVGEDGRRHSVFYIAGHFIHSLSGRQREVSRAVWVYSYLHSISVPLTSGAMLISMLVLARPHILATMRGGWISGQTFVTAFGTVIVLVTVAVTGMFFWSFVEAFSGG